MLVLSLDVGTSVLRIGGTALFDPVIPPPPALKLPDDSGTALVIVAGTDDPFRTQADPEPQTLSY
ncbi:hypothetical protein GCM10022419_033190 [Nonomuraea rosea]|uniref:Uncharacterized protein n=1 Tax=Nonomuraea rosea TaxID=638574 RepID=A0ABP6WEX4_9ACTN